MMIPHPTLPGFYVNATHALQNYGANIRANVQRGQATQVAAQKAGKTYRSINPFPNPFDANSYKPPK